MNIRLDPEELALAKRIVAFWAPGIPAYVFGSRVSGRNFKPTSDLDICLKGTAPVAPRVLRQVKDAFEVSDLPMRVDVLDWHDVSPGFRAAIEDQLERLV